MSNVIKLNGYDVRDPNGVHYDGADGLTDAQQAQARENIGAASDVGFAATREHASDFYAYSKSPQALGYDRAEHTAFAYDLIMNDGTIGETLKALHSDFIEISDADKAAATVSLTGQYSTYRYLVAVYDASQSFVWRSGWRDSDRLLSSFISTANLAALRYIRICIQRVDVAAFTADEIELMNATAKVYVGTAIKAEDVPFVGKQFSGASVNDIDANSIYYVASGTTGLPPNTSGAYVVETVITTRTDSAYTAMQTAVKFAGADKGVRYTRTRVSGAWTDWVGGSAVDYGCNPKYIAFGDSLMLGAVWTEELIEQGANWYQAAVKNRIPTRIAHAVGADGNFVNASVSGAHFVSTGTNTILAQIQAADLTGARLITLAGGRNDSSTTFGGVDSTAGDGTLCGAIREAIEYIQTYAPQCQIVMIQVTPNARTNSEVFTRVFSGGWSLNSYRDVVSQICAEYCVPFVSWDGCGQMAHWVEVTSAGDNHVHPDNEETYLQMGNFIAGRVASYYRG